MRAALIVDCFTEYHLARLAAARTKADVIGIEVHNRSLDYAWIQSRADADKVTLFDGTTRAEVTRRALRGRLRQVLDKIGPDVVAVPGWSDPAALFGIEWAGGADKPVVLMCDSTEEDAPRRPVLEAVKSGVVSACGAGFVSGTRSRRYLAKLGMPEARIFQGYDVVDNMHFSNGADAARLRDEATRKTFGLPKAFYLTISRLIARKNVPVLIRAFAAHVQTSDAARDHADLVIGGDGPERRALEQLAGELGLSQRVHFLGHVRYGDLPAIYGVAKAFFLVSRAEPWGLVLNEAMAARLPVVASRQCGASADLVESGVNGFCCDASDVADIARAFARVAASDTSAMGEASREKIAGWSPQAHADQLVRSLAAACESGVRPGAGMRMLAPLMGSFA